MPAMRRTLLLQAVCLPAVSLPARCHGQPAAEAGSVGHSSSGTLEEVTPAAAHNKMGARLCKCC